MKRNHSVSRRDFVKTTALGVGATAMASLGAKEARAADIPAWDLEADVVVIGSGAAGLPAALKAREAGASVIIVEANWDTGGHAAVSGGNLHSGAGTKIQERYGIKDSPNQYYLDHTTPVTEEARFNDRAVIRTRADDMAPAFEFILENGVLIYDRRPSGGTNSYLTGGSGCESVPRDTQADQDTMKWVSYLAGIPPDPSISRSYRRGIALTRPLEVSAREKGVQFLMNYHMDKIFRDQPDSGRVLGIQAHYSPTILPGTTTPLKGLFSQGNIEKTTPTLNVRARRAVVVATGGHTSNVKFRTMFDPRLGPEYDGVAGDPFSFQDASGELAAMAIGAALGATHNQVLTNTGKPGYIGTRYGYGNTPPLVTSPIFSLINALGIQPDWQECILVNMLGKRFGDETKNDDAFLAAAMGSVVLDEDTPKARRVGGPIWAIFDSAAVQRKKWDVNPPSVDVAGGRFFSAATLAELAEKIVNKYYENVKMSPAVLEETVARYNSFVDTGVDTDFKKPTPKNKIQTPPFFAAWATPTLHDTLTGLRINAKCQVLDVQGKAITGLFAAGEAAGGHCVHGHGKVVTAGYTAGYNAAAEEPWI
jgi:succinate dehydrogenase/fumarate reductase flavoprotein subunit